ncbi:MAG: hypothetical protein IPM16_13835 [Chloroflexi bacterium]|nr:hypothetical protein [Chloroflexota bacterium]
MSETTGWRIINWGWLGWIETALKAVAIVASFVAVTRIPAGAAIELGGHPRLVALIVLGLLTVTDIAQVVLRLRLKDIISMVFAVFYLAAHAAMWVALAAAPAVAQPFAVVFCAFILLGDAVKLRFVTQTGYTEAGASNETVRNLVLFMLTVYTVLLLAVLL